MPDSSRVPAEWDLHPSECSLFRRAHIRAVRHHVRARARRYRRCDLVGLINCPENWVASPNPKVTEALINRLKRALYVERQKLGTDHGHLKTTDGCQTRLTALRIALCAELKRRRNACHRLTGNVFSKEGPPA